MTMKRLFLFGSIAAVLAAGVWSVGSHWNASAEEVLVMPNGRQFYVSPDGSPNGDGSLNNPWDLQTALNQPQSVAPGDVLNLLKGTYRTADGANFRCKLKGKEGTYILVHPR